MTKLNKTVKIIALFLSIMLLFVGLAQAGPFDFRGKAIPPIWRGNPHIVDLILSMDHTTDRTCYGYSTPIKFNLTNNGRSDVGLQNSWIIMNADTREIVYPGNVSVIWPPAPPTMLASGSSVDWTWDQRRSSGVPVPDGRYIGLNVVFSNSFIITNQWFCGYPPFPTD